VALTLIALGIPICA
ncbi:TPA: DUF3956 family protein, partial [Bacillus toyonensis]|nr:DUF3956 family protein [Bacillus toyonensis]